MGNRPFRQRTPGAFAPPILICSIRRTELTEDTDLGQILAEFTSRELAAIVAQQGADGMPMVSGNLISSLEGCQCSGAGVVWEAKQEPEVGRL